MDILAASGAPRVPSPSFLRSNKNLRRQYGADIVELRSLSRSDLPELRRKANSCLAQDTVTDNSLERITLANPNFLSDLSLVAVDGDEIVGCMMGVRRTKSPQEVVRAQREVRHVILFFVTEEHRRKGIASMMLEELEERYRKAGVSRIRACDFAGWTLFSGGGLDVPRGHFVPRG